MKKFVVALVIAAGSIGQAQAWGDREQAALAGAAAVLLYQHANQNRGYPNGQPPVVVGQGPMVVQNNWPVITTQRHYCFLSLYCSILTLVVLLTIDKSAVVTDVA